MCCETSRSPLLPSGTEPDVLGAAYGGLGGPWLSAACAQPTAAAAPGLGFSSRDRANSSTSQRVCCGDAEVWRGGRSAWCFIMNALCTKYFVVLDFVRCNLTTKAVEAGASRCNPGV